MSDSNIHGIHSLATEIERYAPGTSASGRRAETLVKTDDLRVVLVTMNAASTLSEHHAPGTITIQALTGQFAVVVDEDELLLEAGSLVTLAAGARHAVHARTDGAFLLTIAWQADR